MLLAIDTATRLMSVAIYDGAGDTLLAEQLVQAGNQHNTLLAPTVQHLLDVCGVTTTQLSAVAVAMGPGSYTGLRIGVAFAKGVASARRAPLIGVNTLDILAVGQPVYPRSNLLAVIHAGRGRVIAATYQPKKGSWVAQGDATISDWQTLLAGISAPTVITGDIDAEGRAAVAAAANAHVTLANASVRARRAGILAEEAWRRLQAGSPADFDPTKLLPIYVQSTAL